MKKRSSVVLIAILLALCAIAVYVYKSRSRLSTVDDVDGRNFSVKDTAAITRIFIVDKVGRSSSLVRGEKGWVVNEKFNCRADAILNLLECIRHVEVRTPLDKASRNAVLKFMSANAVKVEIYAGKELIKQYYLGHETPDSEGSYMLLTNLETGGNYKDPYACFIPGFKGYLSPRYIVGENEWRDRIVLNYIPPQLKEVKLQHLDAPADSSFSIELVNANSFKLRNSAGTELPFDMLKMKQYLAYFQNISYEVLITGKNMRLQDSLAAVKPFGLLTLKMTDGTTKGYKFYRKQDTGDQDPEHGINYSYDPNHLYLRFENDKEWALIQYYVFGKLLITPQYFQSPAPVKK